MGEKTCASCGKEFLSMSFDCKFCNSSFCIDHRLPENHSCTGLIAYKEKQIESLRKGNPDRPMEYFHEKWRKPKYRIVYYLLMAAVTLMAIAIVASVFL